jgi:hypothetical protein
VWRSLEYWAIGLPGTLSLRLLGAAAVIAAVGLVVRVWRAPTRARRALRDRRLLLLVALVVSVPVGEAIASAVGTDLISSRNLAASWPAAILLFAGLVVAAGPQLRLLTAALAVTAFALGAGKMQTERFQAPNFQAAAKFIDRRAGPGEVVIDETKAYVPGGVSPFGIAVDRPHRTFTVLRQDQRMLAVLEAAGGRIFRVSTAPFPVDAKTAAYLERARPLVDAIPAPYRTVEKHVYPGVSGVVVQVFSLQGPQVASGRRR